MAQKVFILYDNKVDDATMSASSVAGTLAASNLVNRQIKKLARTTGVSAEYWQADFGETVSISCLGLWNHNFTIDATIRARLSANSDMSAPVLDETFEAWPPLYGADDIGADLCGYGGYPFLTSFNDYKYYWVERLSTTYDARYLRLDIVDAGNTAGYLQAGRLIAGVGWQPEKNFSMGWSLDWVDQSEQVPMEGGAVWVDEREKFRVLTLPFKFATAADADGGYNEFKRIVGHSKDVLVIPFPDSVGIQQYKNTIYGMPTLGGLKAPKQEGVDLFQFSTQFKELIA